MQSHIQIPVSRWETWGGAAVVVCVIAVIGISPVDPLYRWPLSALVLLITVFQATRYFLARPHALQVNAGGEWLLHLRDARVAAVRQVEPGIVEPWLVSLRCLTSSGNRINLFVPGSVIGPAAHWKLRRAILAFRAS